MMAVNAPVSAFATFDEPTQARREWMGLLARAGRETLERVWKDLEDKPGYTLLRAPETGMVMVRARAGGEGQQFNLGEMTVTRCVVRTHTGGLGYAYVAGRDDRHAELAALFDALLQDEEKARSLTPRLLDPVRDALEGRRRETAQKAAATRVDFFTLVRGDD